ncbi:MAG: FprA family A-type flavoprotein, partial [Desulfurococcales archaeon]|nr:FprA family A-type flavoprotein [Desulfurococcales archaeon]
SEAEKGILANQYLIVDGGEALLVDPGGVYMFPRLVRAVSEIVNPRDVVAVFYSHQDPDVTGNINMVADAFPNARIYVSRLWTRFLPHLGVLGGVEFVEIPDEGMEIRVGSTTLQAIPAHFLHSPGNFTLYDPAVRVLFSGDIGAAVFPPGKWYLIVDDFDSHVSLIEWFHRRYLASGKALKAWLSRVRGLAIDTIAPQHGAVFQGANAGRFLDWLERLASTPIGVDYLYPD